MAQTKIAGLFLDPTVISGLTAITSGAPAADYLFVWDATDSLLKKILPNDLGLAAAAHTIDSHSDTNTTGTEVTLLDTAAVGTVVNSKAAIYPASGPSAAGEVLKSSGSSPFTTLVWGTITSSDTTYTHTWVDSSDDAILRLTAGGSGSGNDDLTIVAGSNITLTPSGDNLTIAAAAGISFSGNTANGVVTYGSASSAVVESAITFGTAVAGVNASVLKIEGSYLDYSNGPIQIKTTHASGYVPISFYKNDDTLLATFRPAVSDGSLSIAALGPIYFSANDANADAHTHVRIETNGEVKVKENASNPSVTKGIAKAWVNFEGSGTAGWPSRANQYYNFSGFTDNGPGDYVITIDDNMSAADYVVVCSSRNNNTAAQRGGTHIAGEPAVGSVAIYTTVEDGTTGVSDYTDNKDVSVVLFGARAT